MAKMMTSFAFSCLCHHRAVSWYAGTPRFSAVKAHTEHRVLVRRDRGPIAPPPPDPKYGVQAPVKDFEATPLGSNTPPGDSALGTLSKDRSPQSESLRPVETPGHSTLGMLLKDRYPRLESKRLVERPSSCDIGHNTRLATKGSVQQSSVNRPVYSEHVPVTPGPGSSLMTGTRYRDPVSGTRFHRPHRVNWVLRPHRVHRVHRSHRVIWSHRVILSDQFTLVRKLKRKRPTSILTSLSFLFLIHRTYRCN